MGAELVRASLRAAGLDRRAAGVQRIVVRCVAHVAATGPAARTADAVAVAERRPTAATAASATTAGAVAHVVRTAGPARVAVGVAVRAAGSAVGHATVAAVLLTGTLLGESARGEPNREADEHHERHEELLHV